MVRGGLPMLTAAVPGAILPGAQRQTSDNSMSVTGRLCDKIVAITADRIADEAIAKARQLVLDGVAVAVAGARIEEAPKIIADYLRGQGSKGESAALGFGFRLAAVPAALVNAASMHVLDFEPMWTPATHALSPALASTLALAESIGSSGRDVLVAVIKGVEIQGWIRQASGHVESRDFKFHPPGMVGPIGAAVAASHLLGLDAERLANAIGIATSRCGSLTSNTGTMTKSTHCGYAASLGLESALLASKGFTGDPAAFDSPSGYTWSFLPPHFDREMLLSFGPPFRLVDPGYTLKIFPCKFTTHYGITAALAARSRVPSPDAIRAIRMLAPVVPTGDRPRPKTGLEGKFSVQYTLAAALLDGAVTLSTFTDERLARADMQALLPKIAVTMTPEITTQYNAGRYVALDIELADGTVVRERCERPRGSWGAEPITEAEHIVKVRDCLKGSLPAAAVDECVDLGKRFADLDATGVRRLLALACAEGRA
jgi:2-methylcitrate dehydratase PrpD